jgi:hypothetical protein
MKTQEVILLEANDGEVTQSYLVLIRLLERSFGRARLERLGAAVNCFEFEAASLDLEGIARELEPGLTEFTADR